MTGVSAAPGDDVVAPVPGGVLDTVFGTREPSAAAVEAAIGRKAIEDFGRDRGAYLIAYDGAVPTYIYFFGHSGD